MTEKRMYSQYCCVRIRGRIIHPTFGRMLLTVEDETTFPNPDKDPTAWDRCVERAAWLKAHIVDVRGLYFNMEPVPHLDAIQFTPIVVRSY